MSTGEETEHPDGCCGVGPTDDDTTTSLGSSGPGQDGGAVDPRLPEGDLPNAGSPEGNPTDGDSPPSTTAPTAPGRSRPTHDHSHGHASASRTRLAWALAITVTVLVVEFVGAVLTGSLALAADAGHMFVDSSGLVVALVAAHLMTRPRDDRHTWGWARSEVVAAALQAGMLAVICLFIAWEGIGRLVDPTPVDAAPMLAVGALGLVANAASLLVLSGGREESLNMRAAFLEVSTDALGSVAVIVAALVTLGTGWERADAVASLLIAAVMAPRALLLLRRSVRILMEETPDALDLAEVRAHMLRVPDVEDVHDLHASTIATGVVQLTAHVTVPDGTSGARRRDIVHALQECVASHFPVEVGHSTFQLDSPGHRDHEVLRH
ncbi:MAG: cation diffusion facilitator family transporter [Pauljensenia sp.]